MKTFYIFSLLCLIAFNAPKSQAVGIGTASPHASAQLDVVSTTKGLLLPRMTSTQRNAIVSPAAGLTVYETTTGTLWVYNGSNWNQLTSGVPPSSLWQTSATRNFVYNTTDSIGIGTSVPSEKLHLSNGQLRMNRTTLSAENNIVFNMPNANVAGEFEGLKFQVFGNDYASIGLLNAPAILPAIVGLRLSANGIFSNDLFIKNNGNVGIGTNNPQDNFHVAGNVLMDGINPNLRLQNGGVDKGFVQLSGDNLRIGTNSTNVDGKFVIRTGGADRVFVDGAGMSIGTTTAAAGYMLRLGGRMICEEVKVKLEGSWPDYVFKPDYKLISLAHLEGFINKHGHLPSIPTAAEIKSNGLELGDMQQKMMEKIEELTLYIIQLKKEMDTMKKQCIGHEN